MTKINQAGTRHSVLVIEDNELLARLYGALFASLGCVVLGASTLADARRLFVRSCPDLITVDDKLLDATGMQAVQAIRAHAHLQDVPVLATTSERSHRAREELLEAGASSVVTRPFDLRALTTLVRGHLAAMRAGNATGTTHASDRARTVPSQPVAA